MKKATIILLAILVSGPWAYSMNPETGLATEEPGEYYTPIEYTSIELTKVFRYDIEEVSGLATLMAWAISPDDRYIGLYYVNALAKLYNDVLIKISDTGAEEVDLQMNGYSCDQFEGSVGFSGDSKQFYALKACKKLIFWDTETGHHMVDLESGDDKSPYVAVGSGILKYDPGKGRIQSNHGYLVSKKFHKYSDPGGGSIIKLESDPSETAFSPDHRYMAISGAFSKKAHLYNMETGEYLRELASSKKGIKCMTFSADGQKLILSEGKVVSIVDAASGAIDLSIPPGDYTWSLDVNRHNILAYVTKEGTFLWDLDGGRALATLESTEKFSYEVLFSHDGKRLYEIYSGGNIVCWEINYIP